MSSIDAISGTSTAAATTSEAAPPQTGNPGAHLDREAFLKLLVAQLKYQDPTKPADTSQMVTQSAQLTMVDRLNDIADSLQAATSSDRLALAGSLVGRDISFVESNGFEATARVNSIRFDNGDFTLLAGGYVVPLAAVTAVRAPEVAAPLPPVPIA